MTTPTKPFDCVEMKREAQARLAAEYEAARAGFESYSNFLRAAVAESGWAAGIWAKLRDARRGRDGRGTDQRGAEPHDGG